MGFARATAKPGSPNLIQELNPAWAGSTLDIHPDRTNLGRQSL
jgi:hypothetical protein